VTYPNTPFEMLLPELEGKTVKMYRCGSLPPYLLLVFSFASTLLFLSFLPLLCDDIIAEAAKYA
jgi:hypothetical protein